MNRFLDINNVSYTQRFLFQRLIILSPPSRQLRIINRLKGFTRGLKFINYALRCKTSCLETKPTYSFISPIGKTAAVTEKTIWKMQISRSGKALGLLSSNHDVYDSTRSHGARLFCMGAASHLATVDEWRDEMLYQMDLNLLLLESTERISKRVAPSQLVFLHDRRGRVVINMEI